MSQEVLTVTKHAGLSADEAGYAAQIALEEVLAWFKDDGWQDWQIQDLVMDKLEDLRDES